MPSSVVTREHEHRHRHGQDVHYPLWFGGSSSCLSAVISHPLDLGTFGFARGRYGVALKTAVVKVRLQTSASASNGMLETAVHIFRDHGVLGFYNGVC